MKTSIGRAARELGVSRDTLRKWEAEGKIDVERAPNGRRIYDMEKLRRLVPQSATNRRITLAYARVSSHQHIDRLQRQADLLESYCSINGWPFHVIKDVGSGVNYRNQGLKELIGRICAGEVGRLIISSTDRLLRLGSELVFALCEQFNTEVVVLNASEDEGSPQELADEVQEIVDIFRTRLYECRTDSSSDVIARLRQAADTLRDN